MFVSFWAEESFFGFGATARGSTANLRIGCWQCCCAPLPRRFKPSGRFDWAGDIIPFSRDVPF